MEILDMKCAECGGDIASISGIDETIITKALGVLQEDGVYAFFLYTASKADAIKTRAFSFLKDRGLLTDRTDVLTAVRDGFKENLDKLLLAKELLERTLIYARYHAKALDNPKAEEIADKEGTS